MRYIAEAHPFHRSQYDFFRSEGRTSCSLAGRGREEPLSARNHMGGFAGRGNGAASTGRFP